MLVVIWEKQKIKKQTTQKFKLKTQSMKLVFKSD